MTACCWVLTAPAVSLQTLAAVLSVFGATEP